MAKLKNETQEESSHWYSQEGIPAYTIKKKDGGDRSTTLRDARKLKLLPSVTTIFSIMAKPSLDRWKALKLVDACKATEQREKETDRDYQSRVMNDARSEVSEAADLGTRIHDAIDAAFDGHEPDAELKQYVEPVMEYLNRLSLTDIQREDVVVNKHDGYAGRVDLLARFGNSNVIVDFKTRKSKEGEAMKPYEFQPMQIAAYGMAAFGSLEFTNGANIYISTTEVGRIEVVSYNPERLQKEYEAFRSMLSLWRYSKNYDPRK